MLLTLLVAMMRELEINQISFNQFDRSFPLKLSTVLQWKNFTAYRTLLSRMGLEGKVSVNEVRNKIHLTK